MTSQISTLNRMAGWFGNQPYLLLTLTALAWGGNAVVGRAAPGFVSPAVLTMGRWGIAAIICTIIFAPQLKRDAAHIRHKGWIPIALGCIGYAIFNYCLYQGLVYLPATNAAILQSGIPLLIFIMNFLIFRQAIRTVEIIGFSLSLIGVAVVVSKGDLTSLFNSAVGLGEIFMLGAAFAYAIYTLGLRFKPVMHWQTFLTLAIIGAALMSAIVLSMETLAGNSTYPVTLLGWGLIAYAAIIPSILAQAFYIRGVELVGANRAGLFINLVPLFTALLAIVLISEPLRFYHVVAMVLVVGGVTLAQRKTATATKKGA
jgi:drug/metabolite transporter (DMT)-like permease